MNKNAYIGHPSQLCGVEEVRLVGGKGDGMRLLQVRNAAGMEFTVAADRCADIYRLIFKGDNMCFFSPNGYVAPAYYDGEGIGWLKSFTAGFVTTCGLEAVGNPCQDDGEVTGLHGKVGNIPAERIYWDEDEDNIWIKAVIRQARIFERKLKLTRTITVSKKENTLSIRDDIENEGDAQSPLMVLYHMNMGYPLLSEHTELYIPAQTVTPRNEHSAKDLSTWNKILTPQPGFVEQCYFHDFAGSEGKAGIYNSAIGKGLLMEFDTAVLNHFTQWKMMGVRDYVVGLEPGNCNPDGRDAMRQLGKLKFIDPGETVTYELKLTMIDGDDQWAEVKK